MPAVLDTPALPQPPAPRMLTVRQAAHYLGISMSSMYKLIPTDRFPLMKAGRLCYRIEESALRQWLSGASERNGPQEEGQTHGRPRAGGYPGNTTRSTPNLSPAR